MSYTVQLIEVLYTLTIEKDRESYSREERGRFINIYRGTEGVNMICISTMFHCNGVASNQNHRYKMNA